MNSIIILALLVVCSVAQYQQQYQQPTSNQQYYNNQYQTTTRSAYNQNYNQQYQNGQYTNGYTTTPRYTSQAAYGTTQSGRQFDQSGNQQFYNSVSQSSALATFIGAAFYALF